jgi:hypothetical protein
MEKVLVLDDNVIHVHGFELVEILWKRNEVHGGAFMELKQMIGIVIVTFPTKRI